jgi:transcription termination factor NusB
MLTRHVSRELVLQSLFNLDYRFDLKNGVEESKIDDIYQNIFNSFYQKGETDIDDFSKKMLSGIVKNIEVVDEILVKSTSK